MKLRVGYNNVTIEERDAATGELLRTQKRHNRFTEVGANAFRTLLLGIGSAPNYIACGILGGGASYWDTAMQYEYRRVECHSRKTSGSTATFFAMFTAEEANSPSPLVELGLFGPTGWTVPAFTGDVTPVPGPGGRMWARVVIAPVTKTTKITLGVVWEIPLFAE